MNTNRTVKLRLLSDDPTKKPKFTVIIDSDCMKNTKFVPKDTDLLTLKISVVETSFCDSQV